MIKPGAKIFFFFLFTHKMKKIISDGFQDRAYMLSLLRKSKNILKKYSPYFFFIKMSHKSGMIYKSLLKYLQNTANVKC